MAKGMLQKRAKGFSAKSSGFSAGERIALWTARFVLIVFVFVVLIPLWFVFEASVNPLNSYVSFSLWPAHASLVNYIQVFQQGQWLLWVKNTVILAVSIGILQVFITALSAFAFSKMRFWGRKYGLMTLIILQMFPNFLAIAAYYSALAKFNLIDTMGGYILVMIGGSAFNIWLLKNYFDAVPKELEEAAIIDGANSWYRFTRILLPLATPMLIVIFLFTLVGIFSDYIMAGMVFETPSQYTLAVGMYGLISGQFGQNWGMFSAEALMSAIPLALIFGLGQRFIASGLVAGAVKG
ncbi:sugar ABC transporter permease [Sulfoacidibacillus thermotolerans]|nr:ABC transporter permease subunit [Sulfoacidibacillus thermotolerans]